MLIHFYKRSALEVPRLELPIFCPLSNTSILRLRVRDAIGDEFWAAEIGFVCLCPKMEWEHMSLDSPDEWFGGWAAITWERIPGWVDLSIFSFSLLWLIACSLIWESVLNSSVTFKTRKASIHGGFTFWLKPSIISGSWVWCWTAIKAPIKT